MVKHRQYPGRKKELNPNQTKQNLVSENVSSTPNQPHGQRGTQQNSQKHNEEMNFFIQGFIDGLEWSKNLGSSLLAAPQDQGLPVKVTTGQLENLKVHLCEGKGPSNFKIFFEHNATPASEQEPLVQETSLDFNQRPVEAGSTQSSQQNIESRDIWKANKVKCPHCDCQYHKNSIRSHIKTSHGNLSTCLAYNCGHTFETFDDLEQHVRCSHPNFPEGFRAVDDILTWYKLCCPFCSELSARSVMEDHLKREHGMEEEVKCELHYPVPIYFKSAEEKEKHDSDVHGF
ncbi:Hypothetical predicted protein [Cloeon dipterum]|uniref:C2H2-type domain-containing protein n=1 Tax=Cloeon dipterum TaxID=197152 RepID=A0A8S1CRD2_9INSE|nr:Hypothetical predicted protein [Cloeon dipterum]